MNWVDKCILATVKSFLSWSFKWWPIVELEQNTALYYWKKIVIIKFIYKL